jgi:hypothetical protein
MEAKRWDWRTKLAGADLLVFFFVVFVAEEHKAWLQLL